MKSISTATDGTTIFDISATAKLLLTGNDVPMFLGNLSTNDIKRLPLGGGCPTFFCDARAKALFLCWAFHIKLSDGRNAVWLETTLGRNEALFRHLDRYLISEAVEIEDVTARFFQFHLAGPGAKAVLETALGATLPDLAEFQHLERTLGSDVDCSIRRRDPLGTPGYDVVGALEHTEAVRQLLQSAGAEPGNAETYESLRIVAGTPLYGQDIDESRFVMEVGGVTQAVSFDKGCYLGQEPIVMSRDRAGHAPRSFVRFRIDGPRLESGTKITLNEEDVGVVTSCTVSAERNQTVALGYIRWKHRNLGTVLQAGSHTATVEAILS